MNQTDKQTRENIRRGTIFQIETLNLMMMMISSFAFTLYFPPSPPNFTLGENNVYIFFCLKRREEETGVRHKC
jgi:hypothetical protein